jgi:hypothetical protein
MNAKVKEKEKDAPAEVKEPEEKKNELVAQNKGVVDYGEDAGAGFENQTKEDFSLPFIDILQPGSPEVLSAGRDGARAGMIINRVTGEVWEADVDQPGTPGIVVIPSITDHCYTEWKPRNGPNGETLKGGFVARHELTEPIVATARNENAFKAFRMPNGNDLQETFYVFGLQVSGEGSAPIGLAFGSTKIKGYKSWMYIARAIQVLNSAGNRVNPPLFSHKYRIKTKKRVDGTKTWYIPVVSFEGADAESSRLTPADQLYQLARGVMSAYNSGALKADYSKTSAESVESEAPAGTSGSNAPF